MACKGGPEIEEKSGATGSRRADGLGGKERYSVQRGGGRRDLHGRAGLRRADRGADGHEGTLDGGGPVRRCVTGIERVCATVGISFGDLRLLFHGGGYEHDPDEHGARVGLLTPGGHEQVLHLARSWTPGPPYGWMMLEQPDPPANFTDATGINERMGADGREIQALDEDEVRGAVGDLVEEGVEALAIGFLNSHGNPHHERRARDVVCKTYPGLPVSISSDIGQEYGEYERTSPRSSTTLCRGQNPTVRGGFRVLDRGERFGGVINRMLERLKEESDGRRAFERAKIRSLSCRI